MNFWFNFKILRISNYATASTDSAAYIIGGWVNGRVSTIAQYKNNNWLKIGDLNEKKNYLSAIFYDGEYLIVGGSGHGGRLVNLCKIILTQSWEITIAPACIGWLVTLPRCDAIMTNPSKKSSQNGY